MVMKTLSKIVSAIVVILSLTITANCSAQFTSVELGVDGLTCSACTRTVEMSIRKLDFVKDVQMNLDNTKGVVTFKEGSPVSIRKIAKAVVNAGFSVRYLQATFKTDSVLHVSNNYCLAYAGETYQFVEVNPSNEKNEITMKFIGRDFQASKEYKKVKKELKPMCGNSKNTYYVTL